MFTILTLFAALRFSAQKQINPLVLAGFTVITFLHMKKNVDFSQSFYCDLL